MAIVLVQSMQDESTTNHHPLVNTRDSSLKPVVEMRDLTMQWGPNPVLDRVNLFMKPGERIAVVGPSGAGKSTVLRLLAGLQLASAGELRLFGEPQPYLRLDQRRPPDVRLVFQNPALLASLTVEENVGFLLTRLGRLSPALIRERVMACLEAVGLDDVVDKYPGQLSGGMQKRVSFARALIDDPDRDEGAMPLLLYDEPTAGLDPVASTRIEDLIVKTTTVARGCSVVVSHVHSTIERSAERIVMLYGGRFQWDGTVEEYRTTDNPMSFSSGRVTCADLCSLPSTKSCVAVSVKQSLVFPLLVLWSPLLAPCFG